MDNNQDLVVMANRFFGPEDERKATCIHCGSVWYEIHYKDGVCQSCQKKKLPGKNEIERRMKKNLAFLKWILICLGILGLWSAYYFAKIIQ